MRNFFSILISTVLLSFLFSTLLIAQETLEREVVEQETGQTTEENTFANQGPITEADIKIILKVMPETNNLKSPNLTTKGAKILEKNNLSKTRFVYLSSKISYALMAALEEQGWEEALKNLPPYMVPNDAEIKIVKKYSKQLTKLFSVK